LTYSVHRNALIRIALIAKTAIDRWRQYDFLSATILSRSIQETSGMLVYLEKKIRAFLNDSNLDHLLNTLKRMEIGFKSDVLIHKDSRHYNEAINVLTYIESVDSIYSARLVEHNNTFKNLYATISEYCHPNFMGLGASFYVMEENRNNVNGQLRNILTIYLGNLFILNTSLDIAYISAKQTFKLRKDLIKMISQQNYLSDAKI